jgi:acetylornithine/succinyldiaminopimelate/putrescine aminotransferase
VFARYLQHTQKPYARLRLVADEIQTGLGRTGRFLASEAWPRMPDVVTLGKALGGGFVPISAMLTQQATMTRAYGTFERVESHASTFSGNGLGYISALAFMELLSADAIQVAKDSGTEFQALLTVALRDCELVAAVRGEGMLVGIELAPSDHPWLSFDYLGVHELGSKPAVGLMLCHRLYKAGFIANVCGHQWNVVRLQPPLNTSRARLSEFVRACTDALEYLCTLQ